MSSFLSTVECALDDASKVLKLSEAAHALVRSPKNVLEVTFPVRMDSGDTRIFTGWRIQHNDALGPYKGGIRFAPQVDREEVTALATTMSIKNAALGLPYGGAKGGVSVDPLTLSRRELENVARRYIDAIFKLIGPEVDVPAPDVNTNPTIMGWMMDEYSRLKGKTVPQSFTGKPLILGGNSLRDEATGYGGYVVLREALKVALPNKLPGDTTVALQGFGNVGSTLARILSREGFRVVAISDSKAGIYDEVGIDIEEVLRAQEHAGTIEKNRCYPKALAAGVAREVGCSTISNAELLELGVDILIPAAVEDVLTKDNASKIQARIVLEMANGALSREAEEALRSKGTIVIPDVIANGGGVATSYLEWAENKQGETRENDVVRTRLTTLMEKAYRDTAVRALGEGKSLRESAYEIALERIVAAALARGWL